MLFAASTVNKTQIQIQSNNNQKAAIKRTQKTKLFTGLGSTLESLRTRTLVREGGNLRIQEKKTTKLLCEVIQKTQFLHSAEEGTTPH